ncbi:MAG: PD-(D/E)XK nuclease superfamily protein [Bacteroidales bacterium]
MEKGTKGNKTGNILESTVIAILEKYGFKLIPYRDYIKYPDKFGAELLLKNVPFTTIYEHHGNTEFLLQSAKYNLKIRIECKWQQSSGSVDEKLPYLYLNALEAMPEEHIMIMIDGEGWKKGAIEWLKNAVRNKKYSAQNIYTNNIQVFSLMEFITRANNTFSN